MKRFVLPSLVVFVVSLTLVACGNGSASVQSPAASDQEGSAIIKGVPTSAMPNVVAVYARVPDAGFGALCTGEIISPTVVLTAAHCVHPDEVGEGAVFKVFTKPDLTDGGTRGADFLAVAETHFDPAWSPTNLTGGHDLAVVILAQPTDIKPLPVNRVPLTNALKGTTATLIGYGLDKHFSQDGAGVKRIAEVKLKSWSDQFVSTGTLFGAGICNGDSGGPVLVDINGEPTIVGVNSFGFIFCLGKSQSTRPDANLDFLGQYLP